MRNAIRLLSILCVLEGLGAFLWMVSIPSGAGFFSPVRLGFLLLILAISLGWLFAYRQHGPFFQASEYLQTRKGKDIFAAPLICIPVLLLSAAAQREVWSSVLGDAEFTRVLPVLIWGSLMAIQFGVFLVFTDDNKKGFEPPLQSLWKPALALFTLFLMIWAFITITEIGNTPDVVGLSWGPPGTPVTFGQVALAFAISMCILMPLWLGFRKRKTNPGWIDAAFVVGLWTLAALIWWREPMRPSYFATPPMQTNFEYYPNSDAAIFDKSSYQLLYGAGFSTQLVRRPLYVGMLALDHAIAGPSYDRTIFFQILFLALIPAVIYLLTTRISNRLAGLIAGGLIVLREANAIRLSGEIPAAHAKLLMSDLMTLLGVALVIYFGVIVTQKKNHNPWLFAVFGAALGLNALVRTQTLILLIPLLFFVGLKAESIKAGLQKALIVVLAVGLALFPWLWRNWSLTGTLVIDDRSEQRLLARDYSADPTRFPEPLPNETEQEFSARVQQGILAYVTSHPSNVLFFVSNHFFHNLADSALYFAPLYSSDPAEVLLDRVPYWETNEGNFPWESGFSLTLNLAILALGIAVAQRNHRSAGWLALAAFVFYSAGDALARTSGWRFILPVDWIVLMYFSIGLAYLPSMLQPPERQRAGKDRLPSVDSGSRFLPALFAALILIGAGVPIAERRPNADFEPSAKAAAELLDENGMLSNTEIDTFLQQEDAVLVSGMALYPRYFRLNSRILLIDMPSDFSYLHFWLISDGSQQVVLPLRNVPGGIPHTAAVTVIGCKEDNYISAWAVITDSPRQHILLRDPRSPLTCPLTPPN